MSDRTRAIVVLVANTVAFTVCFAAWMQYGVLITFLVDRQVLAFDRVQMGWLIGIPVLSGSLLRVPAGILSDRYGGRTVMTAILLITAAATYCVSLVSGFQGFLLAGLGFGIAGAAFAAGIAYTSLWFPATRQGTALGIFGVGNVGAAVTAMVAPQLLRVFTNDGTALDQWRMLPRVYAATLLVTALLYWPATFPRKVAEEARTTLRARLAPLGSIRVWRFGLYYFLLFGAFVALSQWLIPYYLNVYGVSIVTAGMLTSAFSLPAGLFRALGGWLADRFGPRGVLYMVFSACILLLILLSPPRVELQAPGEGIAAIRPGTVSAVSDTEVVVGTDRYQLAPEARAEAQLRFGIHRDDEGFLLLPTATLHRVATVRVGDTVVRGQLLARGVTRIYFQANRWIFTGLVMLLGTLMGFGAGAVLKHVANYFPGRVGVVGGIVGMLGALGGLVLPILFGYLLGATGIWTTCWLLLTAITLVCLVWMHVVVRRMTRAAASASPREPSSPAPA